MERKFRNRVALLVLAVIGLTAAIGVRLYQLGIGRSDLLRAQARRQHERQVEIWGRRGAIVDRQGRELAVSLASSSLFAHPHRVPDPEKAAKLLAPVLNIPRSRILRKLRSEDPFVWLSRRLDSRVTNRVRGLDLPIGRGQPFGFETEARRYYPQGALASHVVGFANIDQKGIEGVEREFDETLRGDAAGYLAVRDGRGDAVLQLVHPPARKPEDVVLTLDLVLQHIVERELDRAVRESGASWASAILIEPSSGQILALANRPTADLNRYGKASPSARRNRAVTDAYEPGSTFKIVTAAAALDQKRVYPEQRFDCGNGSIRVAGTRIGDHKPFGVLSLRQILEQSSNVGMIRVALTLRRETFNDYIVGFGFGRQSGIELPGECRGLLAPVSSWSALSPASLAFGHEIGVTPLQMASAFATVAREGVRIPSRIVLGTRDGEGRLKPSRPPETARVFSARAARTLTSMLEGVIVRGTGTGAAVPGYRIAGKSGTAQKVLPEGGYSDTVFVASFGGFGPVRAPRIAGLVVLDSPRGREHGGGAVAGPVFGRIMADALAYLRVPPDEDPLDAVPRKRDGGAVRASVRGATGRVGVDTGARPASRRVR